MRDTCKLNSASLLPPFEDSLPTALRLSGEHALFKYHSLKRDTYSTERFLAGASLGADVVLKTISVRSGSLLHFEASSSELERYCAQRELRLGSDTESVIAVNLVQAALTDIIQPYSFLLGAVAELVWRCHIIRAPDKDYDTSFSDPAIPFSIFLSAPTRVERCSVLRVAESLIHETMHLQLTLFEIDCPLINPGSTWSMYSPWKRQARPAQGVLHGLYVFHVLQWMWRQVSLTTNSEMDRDFALRRIIEIKDEVQSVRALENSPALTESGNLFLQKLFTA